MKLKPIFIEAITLPDAWFQLVYNALEYGRDFKIDKGSFAGHVRKEFDFVTIQILRPFERCSEGFPLIPEIPENMNIPAPVTKEYLNEYAEYIMGIELQSNESYSYGSRMNLGKIIEWPNNKEVYKDINEFRNNSLIKNEKYINQIESIIYTYKKYGHRNNQMVLQIAQPDDIILHDPPCLRMIDSRIQDGKLHFFPYFRSWDLYSGFPANLAGISMLQEYMASEIGVDQGEMICTSKGLHLYSYSVDFAKMRCCYE